MKTLLLLLLVAALATTGAALAAGTLPALVVGISSFVGAFFVAPKLEAVGQNRGFGRRSDRPPAIQRPPPPAELPKSSATEGDPVAIPGLLPGDD